MTAKLMCKYGSMKGLEYVLSKDEPALIGRAKGNRVVLSSNRVSASHARIFWDSETACYKLEDLSSTNGSFIDGTPVEETETLGHLHLLNFGGDVDFIFVDGDRVPPCLARVVATPDIALGSSTMRGTAMGPLLVQTPSILAKSGDSEASQTVSGMPFFPLPSFLAAQARAGNKKRIYLVLTHLDREWAVALMEGDNVLGRLHGLPLRLDHDDISRRHAVLHLEEGKVYLEDLKSTNHSYVDGRIVKERTLIAPGSQLAFGRIPGYLEERDEGETDV